MTGNGITIKNLSIELMLVASGTNDYRSIRRIAIGEVIRAAFPGRLVPPCPAIRKILRSNLQTAIAIMARTVEILDSGCSCSITHSVSRPRACARFYHAYAE